MKFSRCIAPSLTALVWLSACSNNNTDDSPDGSPDGSLGAPKVSAKEVSIGVSGTAGGYSANIDADNLLWVAPWDPTLGTKTRKVTSFDADKKKPKAKSYSVSGNPFTSVGHTATNTNYVLLWPSGIAYPTNDTFNGAGLAEIETDYAPGPVAYIDSLGVLWYGAIKASVAGAASPPDDPMPSQGNTALTDFYCNATNRDTSGGDTSGGDTGFRVVRLDPQTGTVQAFETPGLPTNFAPTSDGDVWFSMHCASSVGIYSAGAIVNIDATAPTNAWNNTIMAGPNGNIWVTQAANELLEVSLSDHDTTSHATSSNPTTLGRGGTARVGNTLTTYHEMWFGLEGAHVGRVRTKLYDGVPQSTGLTEYPTPGGTHDFVMVPGKLMLFGETTADLGTIPSTGLEATVTPSSISTPAAPTTLPAMGVQGTYWYSGLGTTGQGYVSAGTVTSLSSNGNATGGPIVDLDGDVWWTELSAKAKATPTLLAANVTGQKEQGVIETITGPVAPDGHLYGNLYGGDVGSDGSVYFVDYEGGAIYKRNPAGTVTKLASLAHPGDIVVDNKTDYLYVSAPSENRVYRYNNDGTGKVVAAGTGVRGFKGDGGVATAAEFSSPWGLSFGSKSRVLVIADVGNARIRNVDYTDGGVVNTVAGGGAGDPEKPCEDGVATEMKLHAPGGVYMDDNDDDDADDGAGKKNTVYIADTLAHCIRKVQLGGKTQRLETIAGTGSLGYSGDGGAATDATLNFPWDVVVSKAGGVFISDSRNSAVRLVDRKGKISTFAGTGVSWFFGDGGLGVQAGMMYPYGIAILKDVNDSGDGDDDDDDADSVVFVENGGIGEGQLGVGGNRIREVSIPGRAPRLATASTPPENMATPVGHPLVWPPE